MTSGLEIEIDRRPYLTRPDSSGEGHLQRNCVDPEYIKPNQGEPQPRQPLYQPGESPGAEPASNRSLSTLLVHAATAYAKELSLDGPFFWAASKEYWEQGIDLGNLYTLRRISVSVGLDWEDLWPKLQSGSYQDLVLVQHEEAKRAGVVQTPTYRIDKCRIDGALYSGNFGLGEFRAAIQAAG